MFFFPTSPAAEVSVEMLIPFPFPLVLEEVVILGPRGPHAKLINGQSLPTAGERGHEAAREGATPFIWSDCSQPMEGFKRCRKPGSAQSLSPFAGKGANEC